MLVSVVEKVSCWVGLGCGAAVAVLLDVQSVEVDGSLAEDVIGLFLG